MGYWPARTGGLCLGYAVPAPADGYYRLLIIPGRGHDYRATPATGAGDRRGCQTDRSPSRYGGFCDTGPGSHASGAAPPLCAAAHAEAGIRQPAVTYWPRAD